MEIKGGLEFFIYYLMPYLIFFFGFLGNIFGLVLLSRYRQYKIGPHNIYRYLFVFDSIYLMNIIKSTLQNAFAIDLSISSRLFCKVYTYSLNVIVSVTPLLLLYISVERLMTIQYPDNRVKLRNFEQQLLYFVLIVLFNSIFYSPIFYLSDLKQVKITKQINSNLTVEYDSHQCSVGVLNAENVPFFLILTNRLCFPFIFLTISSILLIWMYCESKKRVTQNFSHLENKKFCDELKLAITSLVMNIIYVSLNIPITMLYFLFDFSDLFIEFTANLIMINYGIKIFLLLALNEKLRKETVNMLFFKSIPLSRASNTYTSSNAENILGPLMETFL